MAPYKIVVDGEFFLKGLRYDNGLYDGQDSIDDPPFRAMVTSL
jgi:hypothetical protein